AKKQKKIARVHIEIDTGMGRLGVPAEEFEAFLVKINKFKNIKVEGVFTHLASADSNTEYTLKQISDFEYNTFLAPEGMIKHILNSDGVANFPGAAFDMVRPGLMLYGIYGNKEERKAVKLKPALSWKTKVLSVKNFKKGSCISYGSTYRTKKNTKIAVLGAGYNCGYNRQLSNIGEVLINGKKYPVAGRICMDLAMVDLGASSKVKTGDVAVFIGKSGKKYIGAEELAEKCKTVPYDIIGAIKNNITRVFV
ncbi:MAG: alanine racemase, partial [Candidatus Firestonebacteria bacterium]|nr:alanine racemase [Candidatus Firestonebacteria bacterium]